MSDLDPVLDPVQVQQLMGIANRPATFAGDLMSKDAERSLRVLSLVSRDPDGDSVATDLGMRWLRRAGLEPYVD